MRFDEVEDWATGSPALGPSSGWIESASLRVDLAMSEVDPALSRPWKIRLRSGPHLAAPVLREYTQEAHEARVLSCTGPWLMVEVRLDGSAEPPMIGWLAPGTYCWHPFTTCLSAGPEQGGEAVPEPQASTRPPR